MLHPRLRDVASTGHEPLPLARTPAGEVVTRRAEAMEQQLVSISDDVGSDQDPCAGTVRVTSVPILNNRLLARFVGGLLERPRVNHCRSPVSIAEQDSDSCP
jgi:DNA-binding transcriptional LysR family regulator